MSDIRPNCLDSCKISFSFVVVGNMTALKYLKWPQCSSSQWLRNGSELGILLWIYTQAKNQAWWIFKGWLSVFSFHFISWPQTKIWHNKKALNKTNVQVTKRLLNFQQPIHHTNSASPARYWRILWEIPTFQGKWHSDLNEWKSTHLYLPLSLSRHAFYLWRSQKV